MYESFFGMNTDPFRTSEMEPLHQRLVAAWHLEPLSPEDAVSYVRHRLEQAGWHGVPAFEPGVLPLVYQLSEGIPRRINLVCSRLMLVAFLAESHTISAEDARRVMQELQDAELTQPTTEESGRTQSAQVYRTAAAAPGGHRFD